MASESTPAPDERRASAADPEGSRAFEEDGRVATTDGGEPRSPTGDGSDPQSATDGGEPLQAHTIRLELVDEPGELLAALEPIAENGANLLSIFHERGNLTPRGRIPVEVDLECPPDRLEAILADLRAEGVNVIQADAEEYGAEVTVVLVGRLIETDLSDTLRRLTECANAAVADFELSAPKGTVADEPASARVRLRAREGRTDEVLETVRHVADDKGLRVVEPLEGGR